MADLRVIPPEPAEDVYDLAMSKAEAEAIAFLLASVVHHSTSSPVFEDIYGTFNEGGFGLADDVEYAFDAHLRGSDEPVGRYGVLSITRSGEDRR